MKLFLYIYYFFRSVFLRGFVNTLKLIKAEGVYEKQFGIETAIIKKSNSKQFYHYQGASYKVLLKILPEVFKQTQSFTFFDIGCGKGRALFVAEHCGYKNLIGIDLDTELVEGAKNNLKRFNKKNNDSEFKFFVANALQFEYLNKPTVYFLFNPFNNMVLQKVLEKIVGVSSSETLFVYMNPKHKLVFNTNKFELIKEFKTRWYLEAFVYRIKSKIK